MAYLLQHLLTNTAQRAPRAVALVGDGQSLAYADLDRLSNQAARALKAVGVARGDRVGILARKSPASVIAVFAVLKAGACYVPLDIRSPVERLGLIAADCGITVVLCDSDNAQSAAALAERVPTLDAAVIMGRGAQPQVVTEPASVSFTQAPAGSRAGDFHVVPWNAVLAESSASVADSGGIDTDLAYILYTSGSTGVPKGVMISHRASLTFVEWAAASVALEAQDRVCCPAPLHFDLSVFDIFATFYAGAQMVVLPERTSIFPVRLAEWLAEQRISVWYSVPSVLTMLATYGKLSAFDLSRLRAVIFAGEVFPAKHLSMLMVQLPHARYLNWYGPTETNVCTWHEVSAQAAPLALPVPLGRPCANMGAFAVDEDGLEVSQPGDRGELMVRGSGLMHGYWGQPEKTREVLVHNPLNRVYDELVYRTGDLVTLDSEGNFVFLGRRDAMVKTRGYRVELGEVESVLYGHPAVREAVVLPVPDELLGNRLRAVICVDDGLELTSGQLVEHCRRRLPRYMVPDTVQFLRTLPRTSSGKVDRIRLSDM